MSLARRAVIRGGAMLAGAGLGAAALELIGPASAQQAHSFGGRYTPRADPIGEGIWLVRGADQAITPHNGGAIANIVIMASDAGAILVDTGPSLAYGRALDALCRELTGQAAARIYVTHLHPDHSFGNGAFAADRLHALPATRAELARDKTGLEDAMYRLLPGWIAGTEVVLPTHDAAHGLVEFGGRTLELLALAGHSDGDLAILDRASGTLITGDLVFHNRTPATPHAQLGIWLAALCALEKHPFRQLVPGHGPLCRDGAAISQTREWLVWLDQTLRDAVRQGLDMTEAASLAIPPHFAALAEGRYELTRSVAHFYAKLETALLPRLDQAAATPH